MDIQIIIILLILFLYNIIQNSVQQILIDFQLFSSTMPLNNNHSNISFSYHENIKHQNKTHNLNLNKKQSHSQLCHIQNLEHIQHQYFTPNNLKYKFMCKNHKNVRSTHYYETFQREKIYYCQSCSHEIIKQGFSVKNINSILNLSNNTNKFEPKKFDFFRNKNNNEYSKNIHILKTNELKLIELEKITNFQIYQIDQCGKKMLKQLNDKFNDVIKFLNCQKQNCIQLIFQKIDQLKQHFHQLKNMIYNQKWEIQAIKSKFSLLNTQNNVNSNNQSTFLLQGNQCKKVEKINQRRKQLENNFFQRKIINKTQCIQSLGNVQEIIESVYNEYLLRNNEDNNILGLIENSFEYNKIPLAVSEYPSPITIKQNSSCKSNRTLIQEIQNIDFSMNNNKITQNLKHAKQRKQFKQQKQITKFKFIKQTKQQKLQFKNINQQMKHITIKRPSQITNFPNYSKLLD